VAEGPLTADEQAAFENWAAEEPGNLAAFERSVAAWRQFGDAATSPEFIDVRDKALTTYRRQNQRLWARRKISVRTMVAIAASLLAVLSATLWWQAWPDLYQTGVGERRVVMLNDGSRASLDAATQVDVRMGGDRRELHLLAGRAKFDVARDPLKPFSVRVGNKLVVATGTSFSVELVNGKLRVILYEGRVVILDVPTGGGEPVPVRIDQRLPGEEQALAPGRELVADMTGPAARVAPADLGRSLSWEAGQLVFDDEPLALAVSRVNRYSARPVILKGVTGRLRLNGVFNTGDVEAFAVGVEETLPVRVTREGGTVVIAPQ
ncbi:FecR domain-containing protein, partial [Sphingomonas sp. ZT3P38]|uniref:FecR family protein n=1 Tax=Parasphingomonas zepuensis TaxID=3096161 RepID=UPI002FCBF9ED